MRRSNRNNAVCFESLEEALAECPKIYGHLDLLCAGWPCQGNSVAGSRKGFDDERSGLWSEVFRLLILFRPRWFVGENVPGLFSVRNGKDFWRIISDLDSLGYGMAWRVLDSQFFGLAQRRKRVFIVASLGNLDSAKVLFYEKSGGGNHPQKQKVGEVGLCIYTRDGQRRDPKTETLVACTVGANVRGQPFKLHSENMVAEIDSDRKRKVAGISEKLDSVRGILIGNAVSVPVAEWIGKRIMDIEKEEGNENAG